MLKVVLLRKQIIYGPLVYDPLGTASRFEESAPNTKQLAIVHRPL